MEVLQAVILMCCSTTPATAVFLVLYVAMTGSIFFTSPFYFPRSNSAKHINLFSVFFPLDLNRGAAKTSVEKKS